MILTVAGFFSQFGWWFDLASHFRVQYLVLQLFCVLLCLPRKRWKLLSVTLAAALINFSLIAPLYFPPPNNQTVKADQSTDISILLINLNSYNIEHAKVVEYINKMNPDVLALEEITEEWLAVLKDLLKAYPYKELVPRRDNFGIGLYSKIPCNDMKIVYFGSVEVPSVLARYSDQAKPFTLLFTHPVPPASLEYYYWRNEQLEDIAAKRPLFGESLILVGDLNTTSWSHHFNSFAKKMNLRDSRKGFGLQITWPATLPMMGISIDHVLISENIKVLEREIGPDIGSDHYPVYIKLKVR